MGKKRYNQKDGVGKSKYVISYHDGKKKHKDGSDFFDIQIFRNKKDLAKFVNTLHKGGYKYGFAESEEDGVPQGYNPTVNENSQARSLYIQIYKRHGKSEKKFYDRLEYLEKRMGKREFDIVIDNGLRGFRQNPKKYKTDAAKQERLFQLVKQAAK